MRAGSRSSAERKLGFSHINAHTSAVNPITMRINPGMPRKPKRRSNLSSQVIVANSNVSIPHLNPLPFERDRRNVIKYAMAPKSPLLLDRGEDEGEESKSSRLVNQPRSCATFL